MKSGFKYFIIGRTGQKLLEFTKNAIEHARKNGVKGVIAVDIAGRPLGLLFFEAWKKLHPGERPPRIYFIYPSRRVPGMKETEKLGIIRAIRRNPGIKLLVLDDIRKTGRAESQIKNFLVEHGGASPENITYKYFAKEGFRLLPSILKEPLLRGVRTSLGGRIVPFRTPFSRRARKEIRMLADEIR